MGCVKVSEEAHKGETKEQERLQEKDVDSASANVKKKVKQSSKKQKGMYVFFKVFRKTMKRCPLVCSTCFNKASTSCCYHLVLQVLHPHLQHPVLYHLMAKA